MDNVLYKIPSSWKWVTLDDIGIVVSGGTPSTKESEFWNGDIPWITPADLSNYNDVYISKGARNITKIGLDYSSAYLLPENSIVFSSRAPIGYVAITKNKLATSQGFKNLILPTELIHPKYIYYYLKNNKDFIEDMASGTTFLELSGTKFKKIPLPLAPIEEQIRIIEKIEELFSELDKSEDELHKILEKIKIQEKQILIKKLTKYLEGKDFFDYINLIESLENNATVRRNVPEIKTKERKEVPEFSVYELLRKGLIRDLKDGNHGSNHPKKNNFSNKGLPFLTANLFINENKIDYENALKVDDSFIKNIKIGFTKKDDVILTHKGTVGKTAINLMDAICSPQTTYYRLNQDYIESKYLMYYFSSILFQSQLDKVKRQTTRDFVSISKQYKLKILLYPLELQREIVNSIEDTLAGFQKSIDEIKMCIESISVLKLKTIRLAFKGELLPQIEKDSSIELSLKDINQWKNRYIQSQKEIMQNHSKAKRAPKKNKSLLEIIKQRKVITASELWEKSTYSDGSDEILNIEKFYEELNSIERFINQDLSKKEVIITEK